MSTWTLGGETYPYLEPRKFNERDLELPWADRILSHARGRILEVGDSTQLELGPDPPRTILDRWWPGRGVTQADIVDFTGGPYETILSISTLEHVGADPEEEQDPDKATRAIEHCIELLAPSGLLAFTIPVGQHENLHARVLDDLRFQVGCMGREQQFSTRWHEVPLDQADCDFPHEWGSARRVLFARYRKP